MAAETVSRLLAKCRLLLSVDVVEFLLEFIEGIDDVDDGGRAVDLFASIVAGTDDEVVVVVVTGVDVDVVLVVDVVSFVVVTLEVVVVTGFVGCQIRIISISLIILYKL